MKKRSSEKQSNITINEKEVLIWLVSIIYTDKFLDRKLDISTLYGIGDKWDSFINDVSKWVYKNTKAAKLLQQIKDEMDYDGEEKPDNQDVEMVKTLDFLRWVESKEIEVPTDVVKSVEWLINLEILENSRKQEIELNFPKIDDTEFEFLKKEPLWTVHDAVLYVNGRRSQVTKERAMSFIKNKSEFSKLCLYITQAHKTKSLKLLQSDPISDPDLEETTTKPNYKIISDYSVNPIQFIDFIKTTPLSFYILDDKKDAKNKLEKYEKPLMTTEKISLLKMIYGMAIGGYGWKPDDLKSDQTSYIAKDINTSLNKPITDDTVRKWLKESKKLAKLLESED